jgi:mono/diheme cytochrome c family protein
MLGASALVLAALVAAPAFAQDEALARDARALLAARCYACHGPDAHGRKADLRLDTQDGLLALRDGARLVAPDAPHTSLLLERVRDAADPMPPKHAGALLTDDETALLERWIADGAVLTPHWAFVAPQPSPVPRLDWPGATHTAPIDAFVMERLTAAGLEPAPEAPRTTLLRRLSFDLVGLPPTEDFLARHGGGTDDASYERAVDELLASPHFGERWASTWLDLARHADSKGYGSDPLRTIWPYRDWVVRAFDEELPFDRFVIEQLAGDLLPDATDETRLATAFHRNTLNNTEGGTDDEEFRIAAVKDRVDTTMAVFSGLSAGCARCHDHKFDPLSQREYYALMDVFNHTADADTDDDGPLLAVRTSDADETRARFEAHLGDFERGLPSTIDGAPFDPFAPVVRVRLELPGAQRILSLAEVRLFDRDGREISGGNATQSSTDFGGDAARARDGDTNGAHDDGSVTHTHEGADPWWELELDGAHTIGRIEFANRTDGDLAARLEGLRLVTSDADGTERLRVELFDAREHTFVFEPRAWLERARDGGPTVDTPVLVELAADMRRTTHVHERGDFRAPGEVVHAGVPEALAVDGHTPQDRLQFARWLVDPRHPLTARVTVNRFWARLFGRGLVATEEDFGLRGAAPSHPRLLDSLALGFVASGWDVKQLLRSLVTSHTYRQDSNASARALAIDPENRLLSHASRRRLEAEMVRDAALAVAGLLSTKKGGPPVFPPQPDGLWRAAFNGERSWTTSTGEDRHRRDVYTFLRRTVPYHTRTTFDGTSRETCTPRRTPTNTPLQALVTSNDPVFVEAAQAFGRRVLAGAERVGEEQVERAVELALARAPTELERRELLALVDLARAQFTSAPNDALLFATEPLGPLPEGSDAAEHIVEHAVATLLASTVLNLDDFLTRE